MSLQLIPNAAQAHKLLTIQVAIGAALFNLSYLWMPWVKAHLSPDTYSTVNTLLLVIIGVVRVLKQQGLAACVPELKADPDKPVA